MAVWNDLTVLGSVVCALGGYLMTYILVPVFAEYTYRAGLKGMDINKNTSTDPVPESLGVVSGTVFTLCVSISLFVFPNLGKGPYLLQYSAALHAISSSIFLGFVDDVLNIPWRYKLVMPTIASLPLLLAYTGSTEIILPTILSGILTESHVIQLGGFYYVYMLLLIVFCTNSINIYAGINGLETGQSLIIALSIVVHNIIEITTVNSESHLFSLILTLPFCTTTFALIQWNWYPSKVFVGDTFTLFSGMVLACSAILGHFNKTLLFFFVPQILNFLYSLPQIVGIYPCARHRLPKLNVETGKLEGQRQHMNLVNLALRVMGPMHERDLCILLLLIQTISCIFGLTIRYTLTKYLY